MSPGAYPILSMPLWERRGTEKLTSVTKWCVTPAPKSLHGLQGKNEKKLLAAMF